MSNTIFVQMAAYRDPQLCPTLIDMFANAAHPENLHVGITWQHGEEVDVTIFADAGFEIVGLTEVDPRIDRHTVKIEHPAVQSSEATDTHEAVEGYDAWTETLSGAPVIHAVHSSGGTLSIIDVHYHASQGACWARNQLQQLYSGEKYTMQLDSHHRFVENWDTISIDMLEDLKVKGFPKPVLTAYIPSFDPENDPAGRAQEPWQMNYDRMIPEGAIFFMPATIENWKELDMPVRGRFFSAHFAFADGHFAEVVQHDPDLFFHGEEHSIAVRAFTHGYDLFHPHRIIAWHEYTRKGRVKVWDDHGTNNKVAGKIDLDWVDRNNASHARHRTLFGVDGADPTSIDFGKYGFGTERTLHDYERFSGISFAYRGVIDEVAENKLAPVTAQFETEEEWRNAIKRSNDIRVLLHNTHDLAYEDGTVPDDFDFWYVGSADADLKEIYRKDVYEHDIQNYLQGEHSDFRLAWRGNDKPHFYIVWPHSKSRGWRHERIVKPVHEY